MRQQQPDYDAELAEWRAEMEQQRQSPPPRHSSIKDPGGHRWCALLDGVPVAHCTEYDADAGWVQVYVVRPGKTGTIRLVDVPQRRLYGTVTPLWVTDWQDRKLVSGEIVIREGDPRGEPIPGTEYRRC